MNLSHRAAAVILLIMPAAPVAAVEAPSSLQGVWSPDLACGETAPRHIIGPTTIEWRERGEQRARAEVRFRIRGNAIAATVQTVQKGDGTLRPGDVVTYERVAGGLRPQAIERDGSTIDISRPRTFFACRG
jgi:hypothetical protein